MYSQPQQASKSLISHYENLQTYLETHTTATNNQIITLSQQSLSSLNNDSFWHLLFF